MILEDRQDKDLAFMLKFENVAWYEDGKVRICGLWITQRGC